MIADRKSKQYYTIDVENGTQKADISDFLQSRTGKEAINLVSLSFNAAIVDESNVSRVPYDPLRWKTQILLPKLFMKILSSLQLCRCKQ